MLKISKILFGALVTLLALWQLPWCYNFFTARSVSTPFTLYSSVIGKFAMLEHDENGRLQYKDAEGKVYTEEEFDSILPTFYYRQLVTDNRFPDSICGQEVTPRQIQLANFNVRYSPLDLNKPSIGLQQLLESKSGRVDLELPDDVFRITSGGMEFIDMKTNMINEKKSRMFTETMLRKGFRFPVFRLSGNPTDRKEYDEGYVMLDSERKLYHVKQMVGRPYVRPIELPSELKAEHLFITEFPSRRWLCFLTDSEGHFWVVEKDTYAVVRTGIPPFNPEKESILIIGNLFDWTARIDRYERQCYYGLSANSYELLDSLVYPTPDNSVKGLKFTSTKDKFVMPRF